MGHLKSSRTMRLIYNISRPIFTIWFLVSICSTLIDADDDEDVGKGEMIPGPNESTLLGPLIDFSGNLFMATKQERENVVLSPISIYSALSLLLLGAKPGSQTESELVRVLGHSPEMSNRAHESQSKLLLSIARETMIDFRTMAIVSGESKAPETGFLKLMEKYYSHSSVWRIPKCRDSSSFENATGKMASEINGWARKADFRGGEVIKQNELERTANMAMVTIVWLFSVWFDLFRERRIENQAAFYNYGIQSESISNSTVLARANVTGKFIEFTRHHDTKSPTSRLIQFKNPALYQELANLHFRAIELPLGAGNLTFTILEPLVGLATGQELNKLEHQLLSALVGVDGSKQSTKLAKVMDLMDGQGSELKIDYLEFPPFKIETDINLRVALKSLGLNRVFESDKAELAKISGQHLSEMKQKIDIQVNRLGINQIDKKPPTTIAERDGGSYKSASVTGSFIKIQVKNPFMFLIRSHRVPLFIGHLVHL